MFTRSRKGISTVYMAVYLVVLCAFCSLAVDYGRVQLAKTELRRAADSAARAGAAGLVTSRAQAINLAVAYAGDRNNKVDGTQLVLDPSQDIEIGFWDTAKQTFTKKSGSMPDVNAVRIIARRNSDRGNAIPMMFSTVLGFRMCNVNAEAIAMVIPPIDVDVNIPAQGNPFLAGMPPGSRASVPNPHNTIDYAGTPSNLRQSPLQINMPVSENLPLSFDSISGTARHDPNLPYFDPDGELTDIGHNNLTRDHSNNYNNQWYNENGIADMKAPINALVGVFLDDSTPNTTSAPSSNLNFSTASSRDFTQLRPGLKQIFWIGDGLNSQRIRQEFFPPRGATRLFLATWDFYEWNNNAGFRRVIVQRPMKIITVK